MPDDAPADSAGQPPLPARTTLDPHAIERVLARAASLQVSSPSAVEGMSEAELLDVAREAGLSVEHVRRALAEERLRGAMAPACEAPHDETGLAVRLAGPGRASVSRLVSGNAPAVLAQLTQWLEREECMRLVRRMRDGGVWEPRRDFVGNLLRGLRGGGPTPALRTIAALGAAVVPVDDTHTLVRLEADVSAGRRQRMLVGGVTAASGVLAGGTILGVGVVAGALLPVVIPLAVLPALAGGGTAWALARGHRATVDHAVRALEHVLDQLEHGAPTTARPATLRDVIDGVRRSLR